MHRIRLAVRENMLSDPSKVQPQDYVRFLGEIGRGWVYESDGQIAGFAIVDSNARSVWALFVSPQFEGRGVGRALHATMLGWLFGLSDRPVTLSTEPGTRAERFYVRAGWRPTGTSASGETIYRFDSDAARSAL